jgi:polysaccharide export outer membrane protein
MLSSALVIRLLKELHARKYAGILFICAFCISACGPATTQSVPAPRPPAVDATLGVGDLFEVRVFNEADLSATHRVGPDGSIDFPLVGRVQVGGKLPGEVATMLREKLTAFVRDPQVSVLVRDAVSKRVSVYGQVQHPGTFPINGAMTIVQAISLAGGFTQMAARDKVRVSHVKGDQQQVIEVNLRDIADGRSQNQFVAPGDEVFVPERVF